MTGAGPGDGDRWSVHPEDLWDAEGLAALLDRSTEILVVLDGAGAIRYANPAGQALLGHPEGALLGVDAFSLVHPDDIEAAAGAFAEALASTEPVGPISIRLVDHEGALRYTEVTASNLLDQPAVEGVIVNVHDVTDRVLATTALEAERRDAEQALLHRALHDPLTGLPNRVLFYDRLEHALARADRLPSSPAVLFLDLDGFKPVNDRLGHAAGDELLVTVAQRLQAVVRPSDTIARLGGDEFLVLCDDIGDDDQLRSICDRLRDAVRQPVELDDRCEQVDVSIGAVRAAADATADELLRLADEAMYRDKQRHHP